MKCKVRIVGLCVAAFLSSVGSLRAEPYLMEKLGRGMVVVRSSATEAYVGWRLLATDPPDIAFNLYRATGGGAPSLLNDTPIVDSTNYVDASADLSQTNEYSVRAVIGGSEEATSTSFILPAATPVNQYLSIPLQVPPGGVTPAGQSYTYSANDASVGDLDGDGEYEIVLKWDPSNSQDNANDGYTGNVYLDAYKLNGTRLWRIDLGRNIRAGAHYTQFMVYDLDGDGKAEVGCKTADGTVDGVGTVIGNAAADWRNAAGRILDGPEFLTIFNGETGAALVTTDYVPPRGDVCLWGNDSAGRPECYGNRVDRFLAAIAYLDGKRPSLVMCRGYYDRAVLAAWNWRDGVLTHLWTFDSNDGTPGNDAYRGQGNHNLSVGDIDGDGKQEIVYGAAAIDDNGKGLYSTGLGHGDALHLSDMDPDRPGLEVLQPHEVPSAAGAEFRDARTGQLIWGARTASDNGRGLAADIDPTHRGFEMWTAQGVGVRDVAGNQISASTPPINFAIWWDADPLREMLDQQISPTVGPVTLSKWDWTTHSSTPLLTLPSAEVMLNNSTKATPSLSADILGDWREEFVVRTTDSSALRIYTTTIPATNRLYTLMHDPQYRVSVAWQNVAYNQPPHTSFYLGDGMAPPPIPDIITEPDTTARPSDPVITAISADTGVSATDRFTSDPTLVLSGVADPGNTVTLTKLGAGVIGSATADGAGAWAFDYTAVTLGQGSHFFSATAADGSGNTSGSLPPVQVVVDATPPTVVSVMRLNPLTEATSANSVTFRVVFSERVAAVTPGAFTLATTGTVTATVGSVSGAQGELVDVTVGSIAGLGTLRLDVSSGGGIIDLAGQPLIAGFTAGESYTFITPTWTQILSGGLWSDAGNWSSGIIGDGLGLSANFNTLDLTEDNVVHLDSPRTLGGLTFGDTVPATPGSWYVDNNGNAANTLTLAVGSGAPVITVNPMGTGSTATIAASLAGTMGLSKAGTGVLALAGSSTLSGTTAIAAGTLRVASGGVFVPGAVTISAGGAQLHIAGGSFSTAGTVTVNAGSASGVYVDSGTASFNVLTTNNTAGGVIRINGGTVTANSITFPRSSDGTPNYATGLVIKGGTTTVGTIGLGTNNSYGVMSIEGGSLTATGMISVGNLGSNSTRGGAMRVLDGTFTSTDVTNGIVMSQRNNNTSIATFTGGVSTAEKLILGYNSSVLTGTANLTINGGALYVGSGGIVKNAAAGFVTNMSLSAGTLGAKADWASALDMTFPSATTSISIKAADAADAARTITLSGVFSGVGGFVKTGSGTLVLQGASTYAGDTTITAGTLQVDGGLAPAAGLVTVNGGRLAGTGTIARATVLNAGGVIAPGNAEPGLALKVDSLTWNPGGVLQFDLGLTGDELTVTGAVTKGGAGAFQLDLSSTQLLPVGATYTLVRFASTDFVVEDFSVTPPVDHEGYLTLNADSLQFTVTKNHLEPPVLTLPANLVVEATGPAGAVAVFVATAVDAVDGEVPVHYSIDPGSVFPLGTTTVTVTASDLSANTVTGTFTVTVVDTTPPVLSLPAVPTVEATSAAGAVATFTATAVDLVDGPVAVSYSHAPGSVFPLGDTVVTVTASDAAGNGALGSFTVSVRDTTAPTFTRLSASPDTLWPPDHDMVRVRIRARVTDAVDPAPKTRIIAVASNEPLNGETPLCQVLASWLPHLPRFCTEEDWEITGDLTLKLRAERDPHGSSRVYSITVESRDAAGNASTQVVTVTVPKHP